MKTQESIQNVDNSFMKNNVKIKVRKDNKAIDYHEVDKNELNVESQIRHKASKNPKKTNFFDLFQFEETLPSSIGVEKK